jgi:CheY-like chemotaxis protein
LAGFIFGDPMQEVPILVLEDEPDMAREIAAQLTSLGYLARIAATGANQERRRQYRDLRSR